MAVEQELHELYEQVVQEHRELHEVMEELRKTFRELAATHEDHAKYGEKVPRLIEALGEMQTQLTQHFATEEDGGYMAEVLKVAPRFGEHAKKLQRQHEEFLGTLAHLRRRVQEFHPDKDRWTNIEEQFDRLLENLKVHEQQENDMLQEAYEEDVGAAD